jgi:hypothetical protein
MCGHAPLSAFPCTTLLTASRRECPLSTSRLSIDPEQEKIFEHYGFARRYRPVFIELFDGRFENLLRTLRLPEPAGNTGAGDDWLREKCRAFFAREDDHSPLVADADALLTLACNLGVTRDQLRHFALFSAELAERGSAPTEDRALWRQTLATDIRYLEECAAQDEDFLTEMLTAAIFYAEHGVPASYASAIPGGLAHILYGFRTGLGWPGDTDDMEFAPSCGSYTRQNVVMLYHQGVPLAYAAGLRWENSHSFPEVDSLMSSAVEVCAMWHAGVSLDYARAAAGINLAGRDVLYAWRDGVPIEYLAATVESDHE